PRSELATKKGVIERLGARGAAVHEGNAKDIAVFLSEVAAKNVKLLPRHLHTTKLGLVGDGLVLPCGSVGFDQTVRYSGKLNYRCAEDRDICRETIRKILEWENVWPLWFT